MATKKRVAEPKHDIACTVTLGRKAVPQITRKRYGWLPDLPDPRDYRFDPKKALKLRGGAPRVRVPARVDLRESGFLPPVYDQGDLGSCTANAIAGAYEYEQRRQGLSDFMPSRLFVYYNERVMINTVNEDSGAFIRDGMKSVAKLGVPPEPEWPYDIGRFRQQPTGQVYTDALEHQVITYARVDTGSQTHVKQALATGTPVVFGFTVFPWFEEIGADGVAKIPKGDPGQVLGGHAVLLVGYERLKGHRNTVYGIVRNSWGPAFGDGGYCYMPLTWICDPNNADDFWAIQSVEGALTMRRRSA